MRRSRQVAANLIEWTNWESLPRLCPADAPGDLGQPNAQHLDLRPVGDPFAAVHHLLADHHQRGQPDQCRRRLVWSRGRSYDFIPIDNYNFFLAGLVFLVAFWGFTFKYQRSFSYAVTTNAIIFQHAFLLSRSHRRILFDRISEVMVERTPMGTLLGYATVTIMTDSGVGLVEESVGVGAGATGNLPGTAASADDSPTAKASKGIFRSIFAFISYQRTTRR